jgi:hypothetical protein
MTSTSLTDLQQTGLNLLFIIIFDSSTQTETDCTSALRHATTSLKLVNLKVALTLDTA